MRASQGFRVLLRLQHHTALLIPGWVVNLWPCMYCVCVGERVCGCTSVKTLWWNALHHYLNCAPSYCSLLRLLLETLVGHGRIHVPRCICGQLSRPLGCQNKREKNWGKNLLGGFCGVQQQLTYICRSAPQTFLAQRSLGVMRLAFFRVDRKVKQ